MNHHHDTPVQPSATERQLRRLVVPEPAAYAADNRLDVIHEPDLELLWETRNEHPSHRRRRRRPAGPRQSCSASEPGDLRITGLAR